MWEASTASGMVSAMRRNSLAVTAVSSRAGPLLPPALRSILRLLEISQIRRLLSLLCGHQIAVCAEKIAVLADHDMIVVFIAVVFGPMGFLWRLKFFTTVHGRVNAWSMVVISS